MRLAIAALCLALLAASPAFGKGGSHSSKSSSTSSTVHVKGHVTKKGDYVPPHVRTTPNHSKTDNWSSKGNVNPYTGKAGTKDPYKK